MNQTHSICINPPWLSQGPLAQLLAVLDGEGEEARAVGGAVRNALLDHPPGDIDVATTALPEEVLRRAEAAGFKAIPTGIEHGTVTVIVDCKPIEVTTLRQDIETFGRKARVQFGRDWKADAERRDFTINGLSVTRDGRVIDYVDGVPDIAARRVRFIGDPAQRIREDFLRILRFFRFHAAYASGPPDPAGLHAAILLRDGLYRLSRERIRSELLKLLAAPGATPTLAIMADAGLIERIIGVPLVAHMGRLAAIENGLGAEPDPVLRLGALALHSLQDAERLTERLRLSRAERDRLRSMGECWRQLAERVAADGEEHARALLYRLGPSRYRDRVLFAWGRSGAASDDARWRKVVDLPVRWQAPQFPLRASDFTARGVPKGPLLGAALADAERAWIGAGFPQERDELERIITRVSSATENRSRLL